MCKVGDSILKVNNIAKNKHSDKYQETQYIENR